MNYSAKGVLPTGVQCLHELTGDFQRVIQCILSNCVHKWSISHSRAAQEIFPAPLLHRISGSQSSCGIQWLFDCLLNEYTPCPRRLTQLLIDCPARSFWHQYITITLAAKDQRKDQTVRSSSGDSCAPNCGSFDAPRDFILYLFHSTVLPLLPSLPRPNR